MNRIFRGLRFGEQVTLLAGGSAVLIFLVVGGAATWFNERGLEQDIENGSAAAAKQILEVLDRSLFERYQNVKTWVKLPVMEDVRIDDVDGRISAFLTEALESYSVYAGLYVINLDNRIVASQDVAMLGKEAPEEFWRGTLLAGSQVYMSDVGNFETVGRKGLVLRAPIRRMVDEEMHTVGALVAILDWTKFERLIREMNFGKGTRSSRYRVILTNARGEIIAEDGFKMPIDRMSTLAKALARVEKAGGLFRVSVGSSVYLANMRISNGYSSYPGHGWRCFILQDRYDALAPVQKSIAQLIMLGTVLTITLSLLLMRISRRVSRPVEEVITAMNVLAQGNFDLQLANPYHGEMKDLVDNLNHLAEGLQERERIRSTFRKYVSPEVADRIIEEGHSDKIQKGENVETTILFSDIKGFTSLSERLAPEEVVSLLNEYFEEMVGIIFRNKGTLDKYIGDGIMAVWGVPTWSSDHAERACRAALEMKEAVKEMNARRRRERKPEFAIRIGINSGFVVAGSVGSAERMEFTIVGDEVNLASRLENLNKKFGTEILISENTRVRIGERFSLCFKGNVEIRGKEKAVPVYSLEGENVN